MLKSIGTICALATSTRGAVCVVRISGPESLAVVKKHCVFLPVCPESHKIYYGLFKSAKGSVVDEVLVAYFAKKRSYTGDELLEVSCHGGARCAPMVMDMLLESGARVANKGEFTYRAVLNGRIDMLQAEGVAALIESNNEWIQKTALHQLRGVWSKKINAIKKELILMQAHIEAGIDFSEEDIEPEGGQEVKKKLKKILSQVNKWVQSYKLAKSFGKGINLCLAGGVNVGKSTLANALLGEERSIVSPYAGTTRDYIVSPIQVEACTINIIDTAGIRGQAKEIEKIGIEKSKTKIKQAAIVAIVLDLSFKKDASKELLKSLKKELTKDQMVILVGNKADQATWSLSDKEFQKITGLNIVGVCEISALKKQNIKDIKTIIRTAIREKFIAFSTDEIILNARHYGLFLDIKNHIAQAVESLEHMDGQTELISDNLKQATHSMGQILGQEIKDDVADQIFKNFCLGK